MKWLACKVDQNLDINLSKIATNVLIKKFNKQILKDRLKKKIKNISKLQNRIYAENSQSLLIILQGMDSSGKDSCIKHIMRGVNPQGVQVFSFKHPSIIELEHDYLWRHAQKLPEYGQITIFNRSHYENVLISKVHPEIVLAERLPGIKSITEINHDFWLKRYKQINYFENTIIENGTQILKIFLHISKNEQAKRFIDRIEHKEKHWKFSSQDINERKFWNRYQEAYSHAFKYTSTKYAPWYIVPADNKLNCHLLISQIIAEKLKAMNPLFPPILANEKFSLERFSMVLRKEIKS